MDLETIYTKMFDEDKRLCATNATTVEYITNKTAILNELKPNDRILELGAATGKYTIMLADKGYDITALEYVESNLNQLKKKLLPTHNITPILGTATDLSQFPDESFDVVLNMGPLYHLHQQKDQDLAIQETMRVLKPTGTAFFAFINNDAVFVTEALRYNPDFLSEKSPFYDKKTFKLRNDPFTVMTIDSIKALMKRNGCEQYKFIASDGVAELMAEYLNQLNRDQFKQWVAYHLSICEKPESLGSSHHLMYITKKV